MELDKILLTAEEGERAYELGFNEAHAKGLSFGECCRAACDSQDKAQCLKLLEWLQEGCNTKEHHVCEDTLNWPRWDCRWCMSEVEKALRG